MLCERRSSFEVKSSGLECTLSSTLISAGALCYLICTLSIDKHFHASVEFYDALIMKDALTLRQIKKTKKLRTIDFLNKTERQKVK